MEPTSPYYARKPFDRVDLIERLKRTKSPVWQNLQDVRVAFVVHTKLMLNLDEDEANS